MVELGAIMIPIALNVGARLLPRLSPYLARLAKESPKVWTKFVQLLKSKGVNVSGSVASVTDYAKKNPGSVAVILATLASLGVAAADLFDSKDKADPEVRKTAIELDQITLGIQDQVDGVIMKAAAASELIKIGVADREVEIATVRDLCNWARSHFGSDRLAREAHLKMQAFFELPHADVDAGFRLLK